MWKQRTGYKRYAKWLTNLKYEFKKIKVGLEAEINLVLPIEKHLVLMESMVSDSSDS